MEEEISSNDSSRRTSASSPGRNAGRGGHLQQRKSEEIIRRHRLRQKGMTETEISSANLRNAIGTGSLQQGNHPTRTLLNHPITNIQQSTRTVSNTTFRRNLAHLQSGNAKIVGNLQTGKAEPIYRSNPKRSYKADTGTSSANSKSAIGTGSFQQGKRNVQTPSHHRPINVQQGRGVVSNTNSRRNLAHLQSGNAKIVGNLQKGKAEPIYRSNPKRSCKTDTGTSSANSKSAIGTGSFQQGKLNVQTPSHHRPINVQQGRGVVSNTNSRESNQAKYDTNSRGTAHFSNVGKQSRDRPNEETMPRRHNKENLNRNNNTGNNTHPISKDTLLSMLHHQVKPAMIAVSLSTQKSGFSLKLEENRMSADMVETILKLIGKMCMCEVASPSLNIVLQILLNKQFELKASELLNGLSKDKRKIGTVSETVSNCLHLQKSWLLNVPNSSEKAVSLLMTFVKNVVAKLQLNAFENIAKQIIEVDGLIKQIQDFKYEKNKPKQRNETFNNPTAMDAMHKQPPPDDFRSLSVFPTHDDIIPSEEPFVRTNLVDSAYLDTEHYLDVQFRLLREDFVRPLREGITEYFSTASRLKGSRPQGVKVYQDVKIQYSTCNKSGIHYCIQFDISRLKFVNWQSSKRLMFGNLLCLSADDFKENFLFASVVDRDLRKLQDGKLLVEFLSIISLNKAGDINEDDDPAADQERTANIFVSGEDMKKTYFMVESEAYFEAYRHVLAGLQETRLIPLERYVVHCEREVRPPRYIQLQANVEFDFSSILQKGGSTKGTSARRLYKILDTAQWPQADELGLDPSQVGALQTALTNELAIIQGPPGTGKTHVGLIIMKLLLNNQTSKPVRPIFSKHRSVVRTGSIPTGPILIVCYTNHALDQFLEGIAAFHPEGLVRVGGRCKTESLAKYSLFELGKSKRTFQDRFAKKTLYELHCDIDECKDLLLKSEKIQKTSTETILSMQQLQKVVSRNLLNQLKGNGDDDKLLKWLGLQKKANKLPYDSYVVPEILKEFSEFFAHSGLDGNYVYKMILQTGVIDVEKLFDILYTFKLDGSLAPLNVLAENVFDFLRDCPFPNRLEGLLELGFHHLEVRCACLITGTWKPPIILQWLRSKQPGLVQDDFEEDGTIEGKAEFLQNQRMIPDTDEVEGGYEYTILGGDNKISALTLDELIINKADDEWEVVGNAKKSRNNFNKEISERLRNADAMTIEEVQNVTDIFALSPENRWRLYRRWLNDLRAKINEELNRTFITYNRLTKELTAIHRERDLSMLQNADVIAVTTTGASKYRDMINKLPVKIVIVEEAAEVLEAHIVTSMPQTTEHLILIGDHQQLKPSPTVYDLAIRFKLDISLFERLIKNGISCSKLALQHRMRPRIADLLRPHIYDDLRDHDSVQLYDDVSGIQKNVFFLTHQQHERDVKDGMSKVNQHEADFTVALCHYLILQGYLPEKITVLTAYVGQLLAFKNMPRKLPHGVRVTAVDNFQGEENDIILLSLVRSNLEGRIGFLSVENRVCVALSRAKKGLFCIGNFQLLKIKSKLWGRILNKLEKDGLTGDALPLQCKNHKDKIVTVKTVKDFEIFPGGGCGQPCQYRLSCGHVCTKSCHPDDEEHKLFQCKKPCERLCENEHKCQKLCFKKCCCTVKIAKVLPKCDHTQQVPCYMDAVAFKCQVPCQFELPCGHTCTRTCHRDDDDEHEDFTCTEPCTKSCVAGHKCGRLCFKKRNCPVKMPKILPKCEHIQQVPCYIDACAFTCQTPCQFQLPCGHVCTRICHRGDDVEHKYFLCKEPCKKSCVAGHICAKMCFEKCHCTVEIPKVLPNCKHTQQVPCHMDASVFTCQIPCQFELLCGHFCTRTCHRDDVEHKLYRCLTTTSKIIPKCGHQHTMPCYQDATNFVCEEACFREKLCGHKCSGKCGYSCADTKCTEKVKVTGPCGHDFIVSCNESANINLKLCKATCSAILKCGHECQGKCGTCSQQRLHVRCTRKCEKVLLCGHLCKEKCCTALLKCERPDETFCMQTHCHNACIGPQISCSEKCEWKCQHHQCHKLCGEPCDRPPCNIPCEKFLKCGHLCIGLCGEPCPQLCRICDTDEVTKIFYGNEQDENARFVELADCGHIFTYQELDKWMRRCWMPNYNDSVEIKLPECPKCKTSIRRSTRYGFIVNSQLKWMKEVKGKLTTNSREIGMAWGKLQNALASSSSIPLQFPSQLQKLQAMQNSSSLLNFNIAEIQFDKLSQLSAVKEELSHQTLLKFKSRDLLTQIENLVDWLFHSRYSMSEQEASDLHFEMKRIKQSSRFLQIMHQISITSIQDKRVMQEHLEPAEQMLFTDLSPYDQFKDEEVEKIFRHLRKVHPPLLRQSYEVENEERRTFVSSLDLNGWYICKAGHIYCNENDEFLIGNNKCSTCAKSSRRNVASRAVHIAAGTSKSSPHYPRDRGLSRRPAPVPVVETTRNFKALDPTVLVIKEKINQWKMGGRRMRRFENVDDFM